MKFADGFKKLIGIELEDDYDDEPTREEIELAKQRLRKEKSYTAPLKPQAQPMSYNPRNTTPSVMPMPQMNSSMDNSVSYSSINSMQITVIEPKDFDECRTLVDTLKTRKPIIINLEKVETDLARKIFDFLSGATYALGGHVQRITQNIFLFTPTNIDVKAKLDRGNTATVYSKNPWNTH